MGEAVTATGQCLCGSVKIFAAQANTSVGACHCNMCRQWTGGPLMAVDCGNDVSFEGAEHITCFTSSEWAERAFCKKCGSHLFYKLTISGQYIVPVGLLDMPQPLAFDHQIFIDEKPEFYCFANETKNMTGAEVFAQYQP